MKNKFRRASAACGITVETGTEISSPRTSDRIFQSTIRLLPAFAGTVASIGCFLTAVGLNRLFGTAALTAAMVCGLFLAVSLVKGKAGLFAGLGAAAATIIFGGYFCIERFDKLIYGYMSAANRYVSVVNYDYANRAFYEIPENIPLKGCEELFVGFCTAIIAAVVCASMIPSPNLILLFFATFAPAEMVLYFGLVPNRLCFILLISVWAGAAASELPGFSFRRKSEDVKVRKALLQCTCAGCFAMLLSFSAARLWLDMSGFQRSEKTDDLRTKFADYVNNTTPEMFFEDISEALGLKSSKIGGINEGKLGRFDTVEYAHIPVLEVSLVKQKDTVYLKGFTGTNYTGNSWEPFDAEQTEKYNSLSAGFSEGYFPQITENAFYSTMISDGIYDYTVKNLGAMKKYAYLPYSNLKRDANVTPILDGSYSSGGKREYSGSAVNSVYRKAHFLSKFSGYLPWEGVVEYPKFIYTESDGSLVSVKNPWYEYELAYREFVHDTYLDLPDDFKAGEIVFGDTYANMEFSPDNIYYRHMVINYIIGYLNDNTEYSLSAGKTPEGEDFAEYFLLTNKKGSCTHYATAAVLLARYKGIPARYCEGFIIKPEDYSPAARLGSRDSVTVLDDRAHAWAEIYVDGFGWYPIEATKGYNPSYEDSTVTETTQPQTETTSVQTETAVTKPVQPTVTEKPKTETSPAEPRPIIGTENGSGGKALIPLKTLLSIIGIVLAVPAVFFGRYYLVKMLRKRRFAVLRDGKGIRSAERYFRKLLNDLGIRISEKHISEKEAKRLDREYSQLNGAAEIITSAVLKADYSRDGLTDKELASAVSAAENAAMSIYKEKSGFGRFVYRFVKCRI
ncbi:MAG: transglutaminase domain-containing protein [Oscillospiraceae bacterium]|nr:transglutaminase domain-containing protein [Oscillospiraceae bacterium]